MKRENEEVVFNAPVAFLGGIREVIGRLTISTTPSLKGGKVFTCSGGTLTITSFKDGLEGTTYRILGDGQTTVSNNTNIFTNTGANKLLVSNKMYRFTCLKNIFYEDA